MKLRRFWAALAIVALIIPFTFAGCSGKAAPKKKGSGGTKSPNKTTNKNSNTTD